MPLEALVAHRLPGRLRLRLSALKNDAHALSEVASRVQAVPGIRGVEINVVTGSLLAHYEGKEAEVIQAIAERCGLRLTAMAAPTTGLRGRIEAGIRELNVGLQRVSGGEVDLHGLLVVALTLLAIQQAIEGNVMIPAAALLWNAYQAARMAPPEAGAASMPAAVQPTAAKTVASQRQRRKRVSARAATRRGVEQ